LTVLNVAHTNIKYKKAPEMREFMTSQPGLFTNPSVKLIRASDAVGYSEMCGVRPDMEDAILIRENLKEGMAIYGVFDGHGGAKTSTYAAFLFARAAIERPEFSPRFMVNAFRESNEVLRKGNVPCGSTAAVVLRKEKRLIVGHAGDARVVVIRQDGSVRFQTEDHKPTSRTEYERVRDAHGKVTMMRVAGILAVARSIADFRIHGVGHDPDISQLELEPDDKWLLVACDGVFDVVFDSSLPSIIARATDASSLAYLFRNVSYSTGSQDNISAICIDLQFGAVTDDDIVAAPFPTSRSVGMLPFMGSLGGASESGEDSPLNQSPLNETPLGSILEPAIAQLRGTCIFYYVRDFDDDDDHDEL
jgi:serine/threonine protein phosphatase PrpC